MKEVLLKEMSTLSTPHMSSTKRPGSLCKQTMTEINLTLFMIQEEFQSKIESEKEEMSTSRNKIYSQILSQNGPP